MNQKKGLHTADSLFSFLLLLVFSLFTLLLSGTGAAVYRNSASHLDENYTSRTAIAYISEKVRQHNSSGDILFSEIDGTEALVFHDTIEGESFLTYVYYNDGALRELFLRESSQPDTSMGSRIAELSDFSFRKEEVPGTSPLISVTARAGDGDSLSVLLHYCE